MGIKRNDGLEKFLDGIDYQLIDNYSLYSITNQRKLSLEQFFEPTAVFGIISTAKGKFDSVLKVHKLAGLERVCWLCKVIRDRAGYNKPLTLSYSELRIILSDDLEKKIKTAEEAGILLHSCANSELSTLENPRSTHTLTLIKGSREDYIPLELKNAWVRKVPERLITNSNNFHTDRQKLVAQIIAYNCCAGRFIGSSKEEAKLNRMIEGRTFRISSDGMMLRLYYYFTQIKSNLRDNFRALHSIDEPLSEWDRNFSQFRFLIELILNPQLARLAVGHELAEHLEILLGHIESTNEIENLLKYDGDLVLGPWKDIVNEHLDDIGIVENALSEKDKQKLLKADDKERFLMKKLFPYLLNADYRSVHWARTLVLSLSKCPKYGAIGKLLMALKDNSLDFRDWENGADLQSLRRIRKGYKPYKNASIVVTRIESWHMQEMVIELFNLGKFCLLLHDALYLLPRDLPVLKNVLECSRELRPII